MPGFGRCVKWRSPVGHIGRGGYHPWQVLVSPDRRGEVDGGTWVGDPLLLL